MSIRANIASVYDVQFCLWAIDADKFMEAVNFLLHQDPKVYDYRAGIWHNDEFSVFEFNRETLEHAVTACTDLPEEHRKVFDQILLDGDSDLNYVHVELF